MHVILNTPDASDPNVMHESDASRRLRNNKVAENLAREERDEKRQHKLDYYFSHHPPNGPTLSIYRDVLARFVDNRGETPRWLTYPQLFASFARLEKAGILKIEFTLDEFKIRHYTSTTTAKPRAVRPAELDALIADLKSGLGGALDTPAIPQDSPSQVHGCQWVTVDKWRVRLYFGGQLRALGCYPYSTALRLQDVLAFHFSSYRRPGNFNTTEVEARYLLAKHPALTTFCTGLEKLWLAVGVLRKPVEIISTERRLTAIEARLSALEQKNNAEISPLTFSPGSR